jgi:uncharacterized protein (TIGR02597 family)
MNFPRLSCVALIALLSLPAFSASQAQEATATTDPVGYVTTTIKASTQAGVPANTPLSPVLLALSAVSGSTTGQLTGVTATNITISSAGWTASELLNSQAYVLFKSGVLTGLILRVTANTETTASLDVLGADLTSLGAAVGDSIQLIQGDTLLSMFGTPADGVVGGTQTQFQNGETDRVTTRDTAGVVRSYYFNTQFNQWRRFGSSIDQGSVPVSPASGLMYSRIGNTAINQVTTGSVPISAVTYLVSTSGTTYLARFFPTDGTISSFGFQNLPGWKGTHTEGVTVATADKVATTDVTGVIRQYYWNGSQWRRFGSNIDQSNVLVPVGSSVSVIRTGSGSAQLLSVALPYSL